MADWPPVIDADGHVLERQSDIRKYLEPPWNRRNTGLWPSDQPFDTDLFETLGYRGYDRGMSPAQQVETWLKIMDEYNIEEAVLFPTGSGNIPKLREPEFCVAACRAANEHFAKEYNALSDRIHCVGVLPLKWPEEAAKELRGEYEAPYLKKKPSEVVRESPIYFSLEAEERLLPQTIDYVGDDHFVYASDIPHWDGEFPGNLEGLWAHPDLSRTTKEKILYHNAKAYFGLKTKALTP